MSSFSGDLGLPPLTLSRRVPARLTPFPDIDAMDEQMSINGSLNHGFARNYFPLSGILSQGLRKPIKDEGAGKYANKTDKKYVATMTDSGETVEK